MKFLRTPILKNICERLLLNFHFGIKPHWRNKMRFIDTGNKFHKDKSTRPKQFCKNVVFKKFTKFTIKQLCRSLVSKKERRRTMIKERLLHWYFPVSFTKILRTPSLKSICEWMITV